MALIVPRSRGLMAGFFAFGAAFVYPAGVAAQDCGSGWVESVPHRGVTGIIQATTHWDPDGPDGPAQPLLVVGGTITAAGRMATRNIATWDGERWGTLGEGLSRIVMALAVRADGTLIAASGQGTQPLIWEWTGTEWSPLLTMASASNYSTVSSLCALANGTVAIGGNFSFAEPGQFIADMALLTGSTVSRLGTTTAPRAGKILELANGDLIVVSSFGGTPRRWNGTTWSDVSGVWADPTSLLGLPNGDLIFAQDATVRRWDGQSLTRVGNDVNNGYAGAEVIATTLSPDGTLLVAHGPYFYADGLFKTHVSRWDGSQWVQVGEPMESVATTLTHDPEGRIFIGVDQRNGLNLVNGAHLWMGSRWIVPSDGFSGAVRDIAANSSGEVIIAGDFESVGQNLIGGLARLDASAPGGYSEIPGPWESVSKVAISPSGAVFAFATLDPFANLILVRAWDGASQTIAAQNNLFSLRKLIAVSNDQLIVVGSFTSIGGVPADNAAVWTPEGWSELQGGLSGQAYDMVRLPSGALVIGGGFTMAGDVAVSNVAKLENSVWSPLAGGLNGIVRSVVALRNGSIAVAGDFTAADGSPAERLAIWDGTAWTGVSADPAGLIPVSIFEIVELPSGDLVARGTFQISPGTNRSVLARLHDGIWSHFDDSRTQGVLTMEVDAQGELLIGGDKMRFIDGLSSSHFARYSETGEPQIGLQPEDTSAEIGASVELSVGVAPGYDRFGPLTYAWTKNGSPVTNDERISGVATATLRIAYARVGDAGEYVCTVGNGCGEAVSTAADLTIEGCVADYDGSGLPDSDDIVLFFEDWEAGDGAADVDGDSDVDSDDVVSFFDAWDSGC